MALELPQYERLKGASMRRDVLMLITGAFTIGGGIAAVNRLVIKALMDSTPGECHLSILALHEPVDVNPDPFYLKPNQVVWTGFGGNTLKFAMEAWRCSLRKRYDLILADMAGIASTLTPLSILGLRSYVVWCFGLEVSKELLSPRKQWALLHARMRLAISPTTCQNVLERFPSLDIITCELALDPKLTLQPTDLMHSDSNRLTSVSGVEKVVGSRAILCVGRLWSDQRHKGQDALIKAMPRVLKSVSEAQLILAGAGDLHEEYAVLSEKCGVANCVFITGFISDEMLARLYEACYLFAMPSKAEGFGLVYLEAMNWSKPCIGGKLDAARDVIVDHETGLLLDEPHNPEQIADAVIMLFSNTQLAEKMGRAGRKRLEGQYLFPHFCDRFYRALGWS